MGGRAGGGVESTIAWDSKVTSSDERSILSTRQIIPERTSLSEVILAISMIVTNSKKEVLLYVHNGKPHIPTFKRAGDETIDWESVRTTERSRISRIVQQELGGGNLSDAVWTDEHDPTFRHWTFATVQRDTLMAEKISPKAQWANWDWVCENRRLLTWGEYKKLSLGMRNN